MINLIIGLVVLAGFSYIFYECIKYERNRSIWMVNSLNLALAILNISAFFYSLSS